MIVSPAPPGANNGNAQTAARWRHLLAPTHTARIVQHWSPKDDQGESVMLALHARRSADSVAAWAQARGRRGLAVVLTGTDLYQDLAISGEARQSLQLSQQLVVLQQLGLEALAAEHRPHARVIYQSTPARRMLDKTDRWLRVVMCGHLREVKSPRTLFDAARLLAGRRDIRIDHIGDAAEPHWADQARATEAAAPGYRWLGGLPHGRTRQAIQRAHLLVHTSAMEGGAHVIMEAVRSGTPVLASRVDGNVGMLGADYAGYFEHGDAAGLATLLVRCRDEQTAGWTAGPNDPHAPLLARLRRQCNLRAALFAPESERAALLQLIDDLLLP